jgi:hypothetical protein
MSRHLACAKPPGLGICSAIASARSSRAPGASGPTRLTLLSTLSASAATSYLVRHGQPAAAVIQNATLHGYSVACAIAAGIFTAGAALTAILYRPGTPKELASGNQAVAI